MEISKLIIEFDQKTCNDIYVFQDYLKRARTLDSTITSNINTLLSPSENKDGKPLSEKCTTLHDAVNSLSEKRTSAIKTCLAISSERLDSIRRRQKENETDLALRKSIKHEAKINRAIESELAVEQNIKDRSLKALRDRCRQYINF